MGKLSLVTTQNIFRLFSTTENRGSKNSFLEDLAKDLRPLYAAGCQLFILMDTNEKDYRKENNVIERYLLEFGLKDIVFHRHTRNLAPATTNNGSVPIDAILTTRILWGNDCGYLPFGEGDSNHRPTWVDLELIQTFGVSAGQRFVPPNVRRLQCKDPRV